MTELDILGKLLLQGELWSEHIKRHFNQERFLFWTETPVQDGKSLMFGL